MFRQCICGHIGYILSTSYIKLAFCFISIKCLTVFEVFVVIFYIEIILECVFNIKNHFERNFYSTLFVITEGVIFSDDTCVSIAFFKNVLK